MREERHSYQRPSNQKTTLHKFKSTNITKIVVHLNNNNNIINNNLLFILLLKYCYNYLHYYILVNIYQLFKQKLNIIHNLFIRK